MASMLVASMPCSENNSAAASQNLRCACALLGRRHGYIFKLRFWRIGRRPPPRRHCGNIAAARTTSRAMLNCQVLIERAAQAVDAVGQRIDAGDDAITLRQIGQGIKCPREKEDRHHQKVHDQLKSLHVLNDGADGGTQRGEDHGDQHHKEKGQRDREPAMRTEARDEADDKDERPLDDSDGRAAETCARS